MKPVRLVWGAVFLLALLAGVLGYWSSEPELRDLRAVARELRLRQPERFVVTVETICREGRLPDFYISKRKARELGWRPGGDLCAVAPGRMIGGDPFGNREGRLPDAPGRRWFEADLDSKCGRRGPKRLVFSNDRQIYVTLDHYRTFRRIPCPGP